MSGRAQNVNTNGIDLSEWAGITAGDNIFFAGSIGIENNAVVNSYTTLNATSFNAYPLNFNNSKASLIDSNIINNNTFNSDAFYINSIPFSKGLSSFSSMNLESKEFTITGNVTILKSDDSVSKYPELEFTKIVV